MSSWTAASSDCSRQVNNYVHVKTADLYRPNARLTPERQGYQVLTPFGKLGYSHEIQLDVSESTDAIDIDSSFALIERLLSARTEDAFRDVVEVDRQIRSFAAAYQSLDANAIELLWPSIPTDELNALVRSFSDLQSADIAVDDVSTTIIGDDAQVMCSWTESFSPRAGRGTTRTVQRMFDLQKSGDSWVITNVKNQ